MKKSSVILCTGQYGSWAHAFMLRRAGFDVQVVDIFDDQPRAHKPGWKELACAHTREWGGSLLGNLSERMTIADFEGALTRAFFLRAERFYLVAYGVGSDAALSFLQGGASRENVTGAILFYPHMKMEAAGFHRISPRADVQLLFGANDEVTTVDRARGIASNFKQVTVHLFPGGYGFGSVLIRGSAFPIPNQYFSLLAAREAREHLKSVLNIWSSAE